MTSFLHHLIIETCWIKTNTKENRITLFIITNALLYTLAEKKEG